MPRTIPLTHGALGAKLTSYRNQNDDDTGQSNRSKVFALDEMKMQSMVSLSYPTRMERSLTETVLSQGPSVGP